MRRLNLSQKQLKSRKSAQRKRLYRHKKTEVWQDRILNSAENKKFKNEFIKEIESAEIKNPSYHEKSIRTNRPKTLHSRATFNRWKKLAKYQKAKERWEFKDLDLRKWKTKETQQRKEKEFYTTQQKNVSSYNFQILKIRDRSLGLGEKSKYFTKKTKWEQQQLRKLSKSRYYNRFQKWQILETLKKARTKDTNADVEKWKERWDEKHESSADLVKWTHKKYINYLKNKK